MRAFRRLRRHIRRADDYAPEPLEDTVFALKDVRFLEALDLVELHNRPDGGFWVSVTPAGRLFHYQRRRQFWASLVNFAAGAFAGVVAQYLLRLIPG